MTQGLFALVVVALVVGAAFFVRILGVRAIADRFQLPEKVDAGSAGLIAIMFSLFLAFSTSEITQRSRDLSIAVQKEVSVARSIFQPASTRWSAPSRFMEKAAAYRPRSSAFTPTAAGFTSRRPASNSDVRTLRPRSTPTFPQIQSRDRCR